MNKFISVIAFALFIIACSENNVNSLGGDVSLEKQGVIASKSTCADDGQRLDETGICAGRATNYMNIVGGDAPAIQKNCTWQVNETALAGGDYLLYLAATCGGKKARLEFSGGARFADLNLAWSAVANEAFEDMTLIKITSADMEDPHANILFYAKQAMDDPAEAKKCSVRNAGLEGWPEDALVVDVSPEEAAKAPVDEPRYACGPFGLDQENTFYWRVFQGFSWWFEFGQDEFQDIDPRSLTLIIPDGKGGWNTAE